LDKFVITRGVVVAGGRFAPGHLGELTQQVPFEMVDAVLEQTCRLQRRVRDLPARVVVYLLLAGCLFAELGYSQVWHRLAAGLDGLDVAAPTASAMTQARRRLGAGPLRELFFLLRGPSPAGARWRGLLAVAIDGTIMSVADSAANLAVYSKQRGPFSDGETTCAPLLLPSLRAGMLLLADRNSAAGFLVAQTLGLELNAAKTLITHARSQRARFLGYDITVQHSDTQRTGGRRTANGHIALRVPPDVIKAQCARYRQRGKPWHRTRLQNLDDYDIVRTYGAEYRGVVSYYLLAQDVWRLSTLNWNAATSMLKTLAAKHGSTVTKMASRYHATASTGDGPRSCFEASRKREGKKELVARFGGITLRQDRRAVIRDPVPGPEPYPRKELVKRLRARGCELCETGTTVAVHQVTGLKALGEPGPGQPAWAALMAKMRRKTLIVCATCHDWIHANPVAHAA
jgi:hypothetical protein